MFTGEKLGWLGGGRLVTGKSQEEADSLGSTQIGRLSGKEGPREGAVGSIGVLRIEVTGSVSRTNSSSPVVLFRRLSTIRSRDW